MNPVPDPELAPAAADGPASAGQPAPWTTQATDDEPAPEQPAPEQPGPQ